MISSYNNSSQNSIMSSFDIKVSQLEKQIATIEKNFLSLAKRVEELEKNNMISFSMIKSSSNKSLSTTNEELMLEESLIRQLERDKDSFRSKDSNRENRETYYKELDLNTTSSNSMMIYLQSLMDKRIDINNKELTLKINNLQSQLNINFEDLKSTTIHSLKLSSYSNNAKTANQVGDTSEKLINELFSQISYIKSANLNFKNDILKDIQESEIKVYNIITEFEKTFNKKLNISNSLINILKNELVKFKMTFNKFSTQIHEIIDKTQSNILQSDFIQEINERLQILESNRKRDLNDIDSI